MALVRVALLREAFQGVIGIVYVVAIGVGLEDQVSSGVIGIDGCLQERIGFIGEVPREVVPVGRCLPLGVGKGRQFVHPAAATGAAGVPDGSAVAVGRRSGVVLSECGIAEPAVADGVRSGA